MSLDAAAAPPPAASRWTLGGSAGFAAAILLSAALVFSVQPLVGRMLLPVLGGAPAVWNVSLMFFQAALLLGYGYAHLLQRVKSLKGQAIIHVAVLVLAGIALPLRTAHGMGDPPPDAPTFWLVLELALTVGAPFAALSATAPLLQAWFARARPRENPYRLYVASNVGSLAALLAYPLLVEPLVPLSTQALTWTAGYALFVLAVGALGLTLQARGAEAVAPLRPAEPVTWRRRIVWLLLAAAPSSLLLGVTAHLATDVASAPFLWIPPLALYLLTFIIAFQSRPLISRRTALILQAAAVPGAAALLPFGTTNFLVQAGSHLFAFFATALVCHQALSVRKPAKAWLTEFYFWVAAGGVLGGAFNALVAPVIFERVWEYPIVLVLAGLARPHGRGPAARWLWALLAVAVLASVAAVLPSIRGEPWWTWFPWLSAIAQRGSDPTVLTRIALAIACAAAFVLGRRAALFVLALGCVMLSAEVVGNQQDFIHTQRSFFGVHRVTAQDDPEVGRVRTLVNGTTLHGAQALEPTRVCQPLTYYAPMTPIGQAFGIAQRRGPSITIGAVGLGTGSVVSYVRATDRMRFFEIDPVVLSISRDQGWFTFLRSCARGPISYALGDARVTLRHEAAGTYDLLILDAFSSDTVPTHLLTREAIGEYLRVLKPDGVLLLHLSNRNLVLAPFAAAAVRAAGAEPLWQVHYREGRASQLAESSAEAMVASRSPQALAPYRASGFWTAPARDADAWTDDHTAVIEGLWRRIRAEF